MLKNCQIWCEHVVEWHFTYYFFLKRTYTRVDLNKFYLWSIATIYQPVLPPGGNMWWYCSMINNVRRKVWLQKSDIIGTIESIRNLDKALVITEHLLIYCWKINLFLLRITFAFTFSMLSLICEYYVIDTWRQCFGSGSETLLLIAYKLLNIDNLHKINQYAHFY